jgi:low temperature requirement protein LtrA
MRSRDTSESHRAATPLELFFDLCFVVAVAIASRELHHDIAEGHAGDGIYAFALVFFAIWWAWMNFTWFASAYDTDDAVYRITTFVQMGGVLVLAAGIPRAFESTDIGLMTAGYVIMRFAMVAQWLRAAGSDIETRPCALRYAAGIAVIQVLWVGRLALDGTAAEASIFVLVAGELVVPIFAERAARTPWHPHHIAERYGLFTIIVLGESILAATVAVQEAFDAESGDAALLGLAVCALVIVLSMWWLYFDQAEHPEPGSFGAVFRWGYGHLFVFASAAAVGAAIAVTVDHKTDHTVITDTAAGLAVAAPVAVFLAAVWLIHVLPNRNGVLGAAFPLTAALVLATALAGTWAVPAIAALLVLLIALMLLEQEGSPITQT